jgi:hypothetical protein
MTDQPNHVDQRLAAKTLDNTPDWVMLVLVVAVVGGWLSWIAAACYRLLLTP